MFESVEAFYRPGSVREALQLLQHAKGKARIVAGCTDVVVSNGHAVRFLIDVTRAGLSYIRRRGTVCAIGATTTMAEVEQSKDIRALAGGMLAHAAAACGSVQIRNIATVGGNMANGSPAADLATPLLALDATSVIAGPAGRIKMPLAEYLSKAQTAALRHSLLVEVQFHEPPHRSRWSFQKLGRTAVDISIVNVAAGLQLDSRGSVRWLRLVLGAVAPAAIRMHQTEALMLGREFDDALLARATESVMREVRPISDVRGSADYRRQMATVLTRRALEECAAQAGCSL
jgi:carbon-monoxide dehydrogenase medium subunit